MLEPRSYRFLPWLCFATVLAAAPIAGQMEWRRLEPTNGPFAIGSWSMAYDGARQRVILSGGYYTHETWSWDGTSWTKLKPRTSPLGIYPAMAYDAARQEVVLVGGTALTVGETWVWDGSNWTQRKPRTTPPATLGHAVAYDAARRQVVLFGGGNWADDTWVWDGSDWTLCKPKTRPPGRLDHTMAYDSARQRVVLFGGGAFNDTWEWDGQDWTQGKPTTSPPARSGYVMAYDAARRRVVLTGTAADTWEWDGKNWTQLHPTTVPPPGWTMACDAGRQRTVLWAGSTWEWDGSGWKDVTPFTNIPPERTRQALVYDEGRQRMVLFGGRGGYPSYPSFNDTWEWDGNAWTRRKPTTSPPVRDSHAMAYDRARRRTVLFGGNAGGFLNDTWEWDGGAWTRHHPVASPPARSEHAMAYDAARRRVVLFGGWRGLTTSPFSDTWEWDGTNWTRLNPAASPPARSSHAMAYDSARRRIVLVGGRGGPPGFTQFNDTWEWDGKNWTQRNPVTSPWVRYGHALVYDRARERTVYFGGESWGPSPHQRAPDYFNDTWEWDGRNWTQSIGSYGSGRPWDRSYHSMAYDPVRGAAIVFGGGGYNRTYADLWAHAPRDLTASTHLVSVATGDPVTLAIDAGSTHGGKAYLVLGCIDSGGPRGIPSLNLGLLLNPDVYFWFTAQYPNLLIRNSLGTLDTSGRATATIQMPALPAAFIGWRFYHAYVVFGSSIDYASTPVPLTLTR